MQMAITMGESLPGLEVVAVLGIATGSVVRTRFVAMDFVAGLRSLIGGELPEYTRLMSESRDEALFRMMEHAKELGADGITHVRLATSTIATGSAEVLAYGTAVRLKSLT